MKEQLKKIYSLLPFKKEFFMLLKMIYTPKESVYKHLHFKGIINIPVDDKHSFKIRHYGFQIENSIFWEGLKDGWEKVSIGLWIDLCRKSEVIIDIGANTGVYSLIAKALNADSKVYAFEPVKRVFEKLEANNNLNDYTIKCYQQAISNSNGKAIIYDLPNSDHIYSVTVNKNIHDPSMETISTEIDTITLDTFIDKERLSKIDLIKIDVETHEAEVLEGFKKHLKEFLPTILIEILNDEVGANVQKIVQDMNYLYFNIDENKGIRQVENMA
jgi:FkbM family methyltransferase